jgi:hypothetical protein
MIATRILIFGLLVLGSANASPDPCADNDRLQSLINSQGLLVLCAAQGTVTGADSVCAATIGGDWQTEFPRDFAARTSRAKVTVALDWLCAAIRAMPQDSSITIIASLESWVLAYRALEVLDRTVGPEALATAVAFVPSLADLIPRNAELRAKLGRDIGSSLAAGEHADVLYAVVRRIAALSPEEQAVVIHDLWMEAMGG